MTVQGDNEKKTILERFGSLPLIAAAVAILLNGPQLIRSGYEYTADTFGWTRPAIITEKRIRCDGTTGLCTGIPKLKKLRDDCETTGIRFSGYTEDGKTFSAVRYGKPRNVTSNGNGFISIQVPYILSGFKDEIQNGVYPIEYGGVDYSCEGKNYFVEFPMEDAFINGEYYYATTVTFQNSEVAPPGDVRD